MMKQIKTHFFTGLAILLPLVITVALVLFLVNVLTEPFLDVVTLLLKKLAFFNRDILFLSSDQLVRYSAKIAILLALFGCTVGLGLLTRWLLLSIFFRFADRLLRKIPLVNTIYKTSQDIIKTLFVSDSNLFKEVVMVPFPHQNSYTLGIISRSSPTVCSDAVHEELISVFVPTTPNPTTGFLLLAKRSDLKPVPIKTEEAIKYVVSCGMIAPSPPSSK